MFQFISPPLPHFIYSGEDTYPVGGCHPNRSAIGVFDLLLVTRGCLYLAEESISFDVPAGSFALLRPDRAHRTAEPCREETHFFWVHFQTLGAWFETDTELLQSDLWPEDNYYSIHQFAHFLPRTGMLQNPLAAHSWMRQLLALQDETVTKFQWRQQLLFQELLLCLQEETKLPASGSFITIADEAAAYLRRHYKDACSYKNMAEALHFHANYIALCMKRAYGCTPLEYLTNYRIEQAKRLLIDTNEPVGAIAEETGFGSFPYFIRCFNRLAGTTPKGYRMRYR